jgi:hypothetical protein
MSFVPAKEDMCVCTLLEKTGALTKAELFALRAEKKARGFAGHTSALALELGLVTQEQLDKAIAFNKRIAAEIADDSASVMLSDLAAVHAP